MFRPAILGLAILIAAVWTPARAQNSELRAVFTAPIGIERGDTVSQIPIDLRMGKLFIAARVNEQESEFIFDTGSPTILSRRLADTLDLDYVGQNTGVDANGTPVTMDIAVVESIELGGVRFTDVPVLVFDYSAIDPAGCIFSGGVIGSEILPGSAWRIDTENGTLSIAESGDAVETAAATVQARLYDFGYPHAPIIDYRVGEIADKALFDTGSPDQVALFARVAGHDSVQAGHVAGTVERGQGFEGVSAGGSGDMEVLVRMTLGELLIENHQIGPVRASVRGAPPTLVGAGILDRFVVTLDYPSERFQLEARQSPAEPRPQAGYGLQFLEGDARVMRIFEGSQAARAGLEVGDRVLAIGERSMLPDGGDTACSAVRWLLDGFDPSDANTIIVDREGGPVTLEIPATE